MSKAVLPTKHENRIAMLKESHLKDRKRENEQRVLVFGPEKPLPQKRGNVVGCGVWDCASDCFGELCDVADALIISCVGDPRKPLAKESKTKRDEFDLLRLDSATSSKKASTSTKPKMGKSRSLTTNITKPPESQTIPASPLKKLPPLARLESLKRHLGIEKVGQEEKGLFPLLSEWEIALYGQAKEGPLLPRLDALERDIGLTYST